MTFQESPHFKYYCHVQLSTYNIHITLGENNKTVQKCRFCSLGSHHQHLYEPSLCTNLMVDWLKL